MLRISCLWLITAVIIGTFSDVAGQAVRDIRQITFLTSTRGYSKQVTITPSVIEVRQENSRDGVDTVSFKRKLYRGEWKKISESLHGVSLPAIPTLESPTINRTFDGARYSSITITMKDGKTFSHSFDNENPHQTLQSLMGVIEKVSSRR